MVAHHHIDRIDRQIISSTNKILLSNNFSLQRGHGRLLSQNLLEVLKSLYKEFVGELGAFAPSQLLQQVESNTVEWRMHHLPGLNRALASEGVCL